MSAAADFESLLRDLHDSLVTSGTVQTVTEQFSRLGSDLERVRYVRRMPESAPLRQVTGADPTPSAEASDQLRADGNACFGRGEHWAALRLYGRAAECAPEGSPQLSLALANRSAALFQLGRYGPCERDALLALRSGYPAELRYKLHERLGEARRRRGDGAGAERAFCAALASSRSSALDGRKRKQLLVRLDGLIRRSAAERMKRLLETGQDQTLEQAQEKEHDQPKQQAQKQKEQLMQNQGRQSQKAGQNTARGDVNASPSLAERLSSLPPLSHGQNSDLPSASAAVDLVVSPDRGRMLVANRDLSPGDVVVVEPALCWAALPASWATHCYRCCRRLEKAVPCASCSSVQFCSERCRSAAAAQHALECGLLARLVALDVGPMALLALRLAAAAGPTRLRQQRIAGSGSDAVPPRDPLEAARGLVGHTDRRSVADLFRRTATALCLASLLHTHSRPAQRELLVKDRLENGTAANGNEATAEGSSEWDDFDETAAGLLHYLQSLPCNAHEVSEQVQRGPGAELREVGAAVYPTVSLLNHACDPNVLRVSHGTTCVVRVVRPVPAGGELLDNYGFHWAVQTWSERQAALRRQYYFDCQCRACAEDWAPHDELPEREYFLCDLCDAPPMYCYHEKDARKVEMFASSRRAFLKAMEKRRKTDGVVEDLKPLLSHLALMERVIAKPSREFNNCQEAMKLHFFAEGNCHQELANTDTIPTSSRKDSGTAESPSCIDKLYGKYRQESVSTDTIPGIQWKDAGTAESLNCVERLYGKNKRVTA